MTFDYTKEPGKILLNKYNIDNEEPLVTIITPFYNAGKYFQSTYNSVLNQTFPYFEWIIVNDGSTNKDDVKFLRNTVSNDKRIKVLNKDNGGISTARNLAIRESKTDIIIPLDADDLVEPTYIECIYWALKCNPNASWAYTDTVGFHGQQYIWEKQFSAAVMKKENILTYSAGIRKKDLIELGCYAEIKKHYYEDWYLWLDMLSQGKFPVHIRQKGFWYRRTDSGVLSNISNKKALREEARQIICRTAKNVKKNVEAIAFNGIEKSEFQKPIKSEWRRKLNYKDQKIRILMLLPHMEMGGADTFNLDIISRINKDKFEVGIITTTHALNLNKQKFTEFTEDIFELSTFLKRGDWSTFIHYYITSRQIDIVFISNSYYGYYITPWIRKEFPEMSIVDYVHMEEWYWRSGGYARTSSAVGSIIEKTYVCNEHLRSVMIKSFRRKEENIETLYIGVDEEYFNPGKVDKIKIKLQYKIENSRPIVLFPCRINPQKRPYLMLEIAKEVKKYINNICFIVVGDGTQLQEIKRRVKKEKLQNTVIFAGRQDDIRSFYSASDITLICSIKEGLALTAYESLSMGVPVISSDVGGQSELIDENVGYLIPVMQDEKEEYDSKEFCKDEVELYASSIINLLSDGKKYSQICRNCRLKIKNSFTKSYMMKKMESEFIGVRDKSNLEKRIKIANAVKILGDFSEDYLTIYNEYETARIDQAKLNTIKKYVKEVLSFRISPVAIFGDIISKSNNIYVHDWLKQYSVNKRMKKCKSLLNKFMLYKNGG